ncbi:MAG: succinate dehydrogenase cytochrome b subunit [Elusimicrobia bacterium]|nr:succinate dehydrogenase cytochrome b subunit [Elusimicrobiota bacterium]
MTSSIGKKVQVALAGLFLCVFLISHLAGNLLLWGGPELFNHYAEALEANLLLPVAEIGLVVLFALHILVALRVRWENKQARPVGYQVSEWAGGRTIGSATMMWTGLAVLAFLIVHLKTMRFVDHGTEGLYKHVMGQFANPGYAIFYLVAMVALGLHLSHGAQAAAKTLGVENPRITPVIQKGGVIFAIAVAGGFGAIAFWACWLAGGR